MQMPIKMIRFEQLKEMLSMQRTKIYAEIKAGRLPAPVKIGKCSRWRVDEVEFALIKLGEQRRK